MLTHTENWRLPQPLSNRSRAWNLTWNAINTDKNFHVSTKYFVNTFNWIVPAFFLFFFFNSDIFFHCFFRTKRKTMMTTTTTTTTDCWNLILGIVVRPRIIPFIASYRYYPIRYPYEVLIYSSPGLACTWFLSAILFDDTAKEMAVGERPSPIVSCRISLSQSFTLSF